MKKWLCLLLAALMLSGCATTPPETSGETESVPAPTQPTEPVELPGIYEPESQLQEQTGGAVRLYLPTDKALDRVIPYEGGLLLVSGGAGNPTRLTLLEGENLYVRAATQMNRNLLDVLDTIRVTGASVAYYDTQQQDYVFLDGNLRETEQVFLPAEITGNALLTDDFGKIYYCTADGVRCLDLGTHITRILKQETAQQTAARLHFGSTVLEVTKTDDQGNPVQTLICAETGETYYSGEPLELFVSCSASFFARRQEGTVIENLFAPRGQSVSTLAPKDEGDYHPLPRTNQALVVVSTEAGPRLDLYDLRTGNRSNTLVIPGISGIESVCSDGSYIWFIAHSETRQRQVLCRWDPQENLSGDMTGYTSPWYTLDAPDVEGLAQCQQLADEIGQKHGVEILIWQEAAQDRLVNYSLTPEHMVQAYLRDLAVLDEALSVYPQGFLAAAAKRTDGRTIRICLVRSINKVSLSAPEPQKGMQFWYGAECYLALTMGEGLADSFHNALFHLVDSRVLSTNTLYDDWGKLNPDGFTYDYDYIANAQRDGSAYLGGEDPAFFDTFSMSFPVEDRARIMEYALRPDGAALFQTETMQNKLLLLCRGIRKAFGYQKSTEVFPWEQYLAQSIAYVKP